MTRLLSVSVAGQAELVVLGQGSTGASNDLAKATEIAIKMVWEFGLCSLSSGLSGTPTGGSVDLGDGGNAFSSRPFAEQTQATIDAEVSRMLRGAQKRCGGDTAKSS